MERLGSKDIKMVVQPKIETEECESNGSLPSCEASVLRIVDGGLSTQVRSDDLVIWKYHLHATTHSLLYRPGQSGFRTYQLPFMRVLVWCMFIY